MTLHRFCATVLFGALVILGPAIAAGADGDEAKDKGKAPTARPARPGAKPPAAPASPILAAAREAAPSDVITNEDLENMMESLTPEQRSQGVYQAQRPATRPAAGEQPAAGAEKPRAPAAARPAGAPAAPRSQQLADAEKKVADLQRRVADLEKAILAVKNPLLPRTWTKPQGEGEEEADPEWDQMDNVARLERREGELRQAREELSQARQELARLGGDADDAP